MSLVGSAFEATNVVMANTWRQIANRIITVMVSGKDRAGRMS